MKNWSQIESVTILFNWLLLCNNSIQLAATYTGLYLSSVKGKEKNSGKSLALKVLIRFKIELVYSILKPVISKFNFLNPLNVKFTKCKI